MHLGTSLARASRCARRARRVERERRARRELSSVSRWRRRLLVVLVAATQIVGVVGDVFVAPYALASGSNAWAMVAVAMNASDKNVALTLSRASSSSAAARVAVVRRCVEDVAWFAVGRVKGEDASTRRRWTTRWGALAASLAWPNAATCAAAGATSGARVAIFTVASVAATTLRVLALGGLGRAVLFGDVGLALDGGAARLVATAAAVVAAAVATRGFVASGAGWHG